LEERALSGMAALRVLSGLLEIVAAIVIMKFGKIETALRINAMLGLAGPIVFLLVSVLGVIAVAVRIIPWKVGLIILGILFVMIGTK
jgi:hypothetical protein